MLPSGGQLGGARGQQHELDIYLILCGSSGYLGSDCFIFNVDTNVQMGSAKVWKFPHLDDYNQQLP